MRHHRLAWITAAAITVVPFAPVPASAAVAVPGRAVAPAAVPAPTLAKHVDTDMDGDGTRDSVTLNYLGSNRFQLVVTTTKGKTAKATFTSRVDAKWAPPADTWYGASAIDGRKGSELIVNKFTRKTAESRFNVTLGVYTWRSGKLVAEKAPASLWGKTWKVNATQAGEARGYNFFTRSGHRYVDVTRMTTGKYTSPWNGHVTRSVWRNGAWVKLWTHKARTVKGSTLTKWGQVGIAGPKLLLGQVNVDVSGDGARDLVLFHQNGMDHYLLTANAGSAGTASTGFASVAAKPFIGAAEVDSAPGMELLVNIDPEGPLWKVLTWRGSGLLAELPGPAMYGGDGNGTWHGHGDEATANFALSVEGGSHYVVTGWISYEDSVATDPVHFAKSVWEVDHWTKLGEWDAVLTAEQRATFHNGFTVDGLVSP
ncbi:MAG: hypothetical protein J0I14_09125 [Propionibacteriaceae bacterium]|nr:hypothetical protein [Propionibacteriaceae bacterium]